MNNNNFQTIQDKFFNISVHNVEHKNIQQEQNIQHEQNEQNKINEDKKLIECIPLFLIDNSGSTHQVVPFSNKSILKNEIDIVQKIMGQKKYSKCYIMFWNTAETHNKEPIDFNEISNIITSMKISSVGGTDISVAINGIPENWYQSKTELYILTDGENNSDRYKFSSQILNLTKRRININIITMEPNNCNYLDNQVQAGSTIYKIIQENKLSKYIRSFECYNSFHFDEPFINFYNPELKKGQFSYEKLVFSEENFNLFTDLISELVDFHKTNKNELDKILYHLSLTIYQYTKNKTQRIKREIVRLFVGLFEEYYEDVDFVKNMFESEIKNHDEGVSATFQQYKANRKRLFERTQDELYANVADCFAKKNKFISFPIKTTNPTLIKLIQSNSMKQSIRLSDLCFESGGIKYGTYDIPMFSFETKDSEQASQAFRQWIRAIYSRVHSIQISDEKILYLFLTDMMSVVFSDLDESIKSAYKNGARIMLDANRFNSGGVKQITWLTMGNKPSPMIPGYNTMDEIFEYCKKYYNPNLVISNNEFWYGICLAFGLSEPHKNFCETKNFIRGQNDLILSQIPNGFNSENLINLLSLNNKKYSLQIVDCIDEYDYFDYITLEDTSISGGYALPDYKIGKKVFKSKFVISQETYDFLKAESKNNDFKTKCPITGRMIRLDSFIEVEPKNLKTQFEVNTNDFDYGIFDSTKYQKIDINKLDSINLIDLELKKSTDYDFSNYPYEFFPKVPLITEKLYKERIQYRTTEEFKNQITLRFDWLNNLDMNNIAIAGGFCKSLIFDEKVNDIDVYLYGFENDQDYSNRLSKLIGDFTQIISNKFPNSVSLQAYKKEFNVYELIYFENIKDLQKQNFELQDLTQMKYITKIQIIMRKHIKKNEIFNSFDLDSCCVMWDGVDLLFNDRSYYAYKYMINIPRIDKFYTDLYDLRILKYYGSGFRIVLPRMTIEQIKAKLSDENTFVINKSKFIVNSIEANNVYIDKTEFVVVKEDKPKNVSVSIYNSIIGDLGSLNDSRSIVKFMKYVQRQNRIVERVRKNLEEGVQMDDDQLAETINDEMKEELKDLKFFNKTNVKNNALLESDSEHEEPDSEHEEPDSKHEDSESDSEKSDDSKLHYDKPVKLINPWLNSDKSLNIAKIDNSDESFKNLMNKKEQQIIELDKQIDEINNQIKYFDKQINKINQQNNQQNNQQDNQQHNQQDNQQDNQQNNQQDNQEKVLENKFEKFKLVDQNGEEPKLPEEYIKVYWKVCTKNSQYKINEFENGNTELNFIWEYENYHKQFDWYSKDQEKEQIEKQKQREIEEKEKEKEKERLKNEEKVNSSNQINNPTNEVKIDLYDSDCESDCESDC
jgi:hypothetical protein